MGGDRYVVLGLAPVRATWFREVGRWATAAAIPVEFVRCVSAEEVRARFATGRPLSALLVDAGVPGVDRDLVDVARRAGAAVIVVDDGRAVRDWSGIGATAVLGSDFDRRELLDELERHASPIGRVGSVPAERTRPGEPSEPAGRIVSVVGSGGTGASTVAIAIAQGIGCEPRHHGLVLLADLALDADQAMLHDARDVVPGLQELVEAHRSGYPTIAEVRETIFDVPGRGYHLLLGLRRHRDWSALRPRAVEAALETLRGGYRVVVVDSDPDVEGQDRCGSIEVEERNQLARTAIAGSAVVAVVATPSMKGMHSLLRVIADLIDFGVGPARILAVFNRSARSPSQRAELSGVFGDLARGISPALASPIHLPDRRAVDEALRDGARLPSAFARPVTTAVLAMLDRAAPLDDGRAEPALVAPGSLGSWTADESWGGD